MITLDSSAMFGEGNHRQCYVHPQNKNLCIKILVDDGLTTRQETREIRYFRHLQRRGISWEMLPRYHGEVETNLGTGPVFDLITDEDGSVSKTLTHYLSSVELTTENYQDLVDALRRFKRYLLDQRIISSISARNIVCPRDGQRIVKMVMIDNIGNAALIPIHNHLGYLARRKIQRKWKRFEGYLREEFPHNPHVETLLAAVDF